MVSMQPTANPKTNSQQNALQSLYDELGVKTPLELSNKFTELDQELMRSGNYDYNNGKLPTNRIKNHLEGIDPSLLTAEENTWRNEILWLWHHHATSMALFGFQDGETARHFADKALEYQAEGHQNKLTRLLLILADGDVTRAKQYVQDEVPKDSVEYGSALEAIEVYRQLRLQ